MIDSQGYRPNVGIILMNPQGKLLWAKRVGQDAWQFPQGGIKKNERVEDALFRELEEEVGLLDSHVCIVGSTKDWLRYELPERYLRQDSNQNFVGQKQKWFLLYAEKADNKIDLTRSPVPEFDHWRWVSYWFPVNQVIEFKRNVYRQALTELAPAYIQHLQTIT